MDEIRNWIKGDQDYGEGVKLFFQYGKDAVLKSLFTLPETSFTRGKLVKALEAIVPAEKKPVEEPVDPRITPKPVLNLIRRRSQLHEALFTATSKTDRHTIALTILAIGKKLDRFYDHGELPNDQVENGEQETDIPSNAWELHMLINNNIAYVAKNRKKEDKQGEVKRRERQNGQIEERLKSMVYEPVS